MFITMPDIFNSVSALDLSRQITCLFCFILNIVLKDHSYKSDGNEQIDW